MCKRTQLVMQTQPSLQVVAQHKFGACASFLLSLECCCSCACFGAALLRQQRALRFGPKGILHCLLLSGYFASPGSLSANAKGLGSSMLVVWVLFTFCVASSAKSDISATVATPTWEPNTVSYRLHFVCQARLSCHARHVLSFFLVEVDHYKRTVSAVSLTSVSPSWWGVEVDLKRTGTKLRLLVWWEQHSQQTMQGVIGCC